MPKDSRFTGFAIALAWPATYCRRPNGWYDPLANLFGISKHHYYMAGHAALVLVDSQNKKCHYFDFGRYHAPFNFGRVRSAVSDHGLEVRTLPTISGDGQIIENFMEILTELQTNAECHGEGNLYASYCPVNFAKAFKKATHLQHISPIPYGPFQYKGSNCSRFVNDVIVAGDPTWKHVLWLKYLVPLTPTPLNNVNSLTNKVVLPKMLINLPFSPQPIPDKKILKTTLFAPARHAKIPGAAQWLSGEGAGSWFHIEPEGSHFQISRFSPEGELECDGKFTPQNGSYFNLASTFSIGYLSHCHRVVINQNNQLIELKRIG
ncbi:MAG: hypothetical protein IH598_09360 [Bacteroidales bacterium]|nr:hypothetical protein [Bacteroidales bacterium]